MKSKQGFSLPELVFVVCIVGVIAAAGFLVYKHLNRNTGATFSYGSNTVPTFSYGSFKYLHSAMASADAQTIVNNFQTALDKNFPTVSTLQCGETLNQTSCPSLPPKTISVSQASIDYNASPRLVAGYNFYVAPDTYISDQTASSVELDVATQNRASTAAFNYFLSDQIRAENFSSSSPLLKSNPIPNGDGTVVYTTFYSQTTLCEVDDSVDSDGSASDTMICAPIKLYTQDAQMLKPLFNAFVAADKEFSDPAQSGMWVEFSPNETSQFNSYIVDGNTPGYKIGSLEIDVIDAKDPSYNSSLDGNTAYFWEHDTVWNLLTDKNTTPPNQEDTGYLACSFTFPNESAKQAFAGQTCQNYNQDFTTGTFQ